MGKGEAQYNNTQPGCRVITDHLCTGTSASQNRGYFLEGPRYYPADRDIILCLCRVVVITGAGCSGGTHVLQREQNDGDILS